MDKILKEMLEQMDIVGYNGKPFAEDLLESVKTKQKRGKKNKQIRYIHYCLWARDLLLKELGPAGKSFSYPQCILAYIREIAPGDIVGELRDDAYKISMEEFCEGLPKK